MQKSNDENWIQIVYSDIIGGSFFSK